MAVAVYTAMEYHPPSYGFVVAVKVPTESTDTFKYNQRSITSSQRLSGGPIREGLRGASTLFTVIPKAQLGMYLFNQHIVILEINLLLKETHVNSA